MLVLLEYSALLAAEPHVHVSGLVSSEATIVVAVPSAVVPELHLGVQEPGDPQERGEQPHLQLA